jgi:hypothetical protein
MKTVVVAIQELLARVVAVEPLDGHDGRAG